MKKMINIRGQYFPEEYKEYQGCRNCKNQKEPLTMCEYGEHRNRIELICLRWEKKAKDK